MVTERLSLRTVTILCDTSETFRTRRTINAAGIFGDCWSFRMPSSIAKRGLDSIRHGLDVLERERLRWPGAGLLNLYVRLTVEGRTEIRRFKRCRFCEHGLRGIGISEPWNTWYRSLPLA